MTTLDTTHCPYCTKLDGNHHPLCVAQIHINPEISYAQASDAFADATQELTQAIQKFNTAKLRLELILSTWKLEPKNAP